MVFVALVTYFTKNNHDVYGALTFSCAHNEIVRPDLPVLFNNKEDTERYLCDKMEIDILNMINYYSIKHKEQKKTDPSSRSRRELKELGVIKYLTEVEHNALNRPETETYSFGQLRSHFELKPCYKGNFTVMSTLYKIFLKVEPLVREDFSRYYLDSIDWLATYKIKEIQIR